MPRKKGDVPGTYMGEAERIIRKYAAENPLLAVWRGKYVVLGETKSPVDVILVGMPDENNPGVPSSLIVLWTYSKHGGQRAKMKLSASDGSDRYFSTPFGGGHSPITRINELAAQLPDL